MEIMPNKCSIGWSPGRTTAFNKFTTVVSSIELLCPSQPTGTITMDRYELSRPQGSTPGSTQPAKPQEKHEQGRNDPRRLV